MWHTWNPSKRHTRLDWSTILLPHLSLIEMIGAHVWLTSIVIISFITDVVQKINGQAFSVYKFGLVSFFGAQRVADAHTGMSWKCVV